MRIPAKRPISLRRSLQLLVLICVVPATALLAFSVFDSYRQYKQNIYAAAQHLAENMIAEVDRELTGIESGLKILATSEALQNGNFARFHNIAREAVQSQIVYNYILTDRNGRQLLNTFKPFGTPLPATGTPPQLAAVFSEGRTILTDYFIGPVTGKPAIAMGVPVANSAGEILYSVNIGLDPQRLSEILKRQPLEDGWLAALIDTSGTIVGRTRKEEQFVGKKAVDDLIAHIKTQRNGTMLGKTKEGGEVVVAYASSRRWNWAIAVGAPKELLEAKLQAAVSTVLLSGLTILLIASSMVLMIIRRLTDSVDALNRAATAMHAGKPVELPELQLKEAEAVGQAIVHASQLTSEIHHRAYHDALTDLANRPLLYEFLEKSLAHANRTGQPFSLILLDLDHFKEVNDQYGHAAGDQLLKIAADRIREQIRAADLAARIGGDEFAVLLSSADRSQAFEVAHRLAQSLAAPYPECSIQISASLGFVTWWRGVKDGAMLIELADQAMYQVKSGGRNGVREAEPHTP